MESTTTLSKSLKQLTTLFQSPPTMDNLSNLRMNLISTINNINRTILDKFEKDKSWLRGKIKEVVQCEKNFIQNCEKGECDTEQLQCAIEILTHLAYLKIFSKAACFPLPEHLAALQKICVTSDDKLQEHLDNIVEQTHLSCKIATKNCFYNRYANVLPYDDSLVKLKSEKYISASDARFDEKKYLIASAPFIAIRGGITINTLPDWWAMILEHDTRLIVMTTNLVEGHSKCEDYFSTEETVNETLGELRKSWECQTVEKTIEEEKDKQALIKRVITLKGPDGETREIVHLQYSNWPDFGAADPKLFLKYWKLIVDEEKKFSTVTHTPLFHCSAGLGRTGTTLALLFLLELLEESREPLKESPDIDSCILSLRTRRKGLVQSGVQYKFIARVLIEYFRQKIMNQKKFNTLRQLNLPHGHYLISGSGPLGIRGLREIQDIDLLVSDELWETLKAKHGIVEENGIKKIVIGEIEAFGKKSFPEEVEVSTEKRLADAEMIDGLPFESLEHVIMFKRRQGREKDLRDLELLKQWQASREGT